MVSESNVDGLSDKRVFVTGGANGIGREIVRAFAAQGARVSFCDIDEEGGNTLERDVADSVFYKVDVTDAARLEAAMRSAGEIEILVNNVGIGGFKPLTEATVEDFDRVIATNLRPVFIASRQFALLRAACNTYGRIINIASTRWLQSEPGTEGYAASKGGIVSLTHSLALSLSGTCVTVNCISPGWIDNDHYAGLTAEDHSQHPSGRVGVPSDIARACLFISHPENDFINGANIVVDGGMTRKMIYI